MTDNRRIFENMLAWCKTEIIKGKHSAEELLFISATMSHAIEGLSKLENQQ